MCEHSNPFSLFKYWPVFSNGIILKSKSECPITPKLLQYHSKFLYISFQFTHLPIIRMRNRDQYRMSIKGICGLALEESKMHTFSRI